MSRFNVVSTAATLLALPSIFSVLAAASTTSGCSSASSWVFDATGHSNQTIGDRSFLVHIPPNYVPTKAHATVINFHGAGDSDTEQEFISGMSEKGLLINGLGIIAVYPMGAFGPGKSGNDTKRAWQGAPYAKAGVDDLSFTQTIIDELKANLCVDEKRIFAAGKSNGGGFVNLLACNSSTASLFAAFAPVSAALYAGTLPFTGCDPGRTVPLINFHGLSDHVIPFDGRLADQEGNTAYALPNITQYREAWAARDGCPSPVPSHLTHPETNTTLKEWDCSAGDSNAIVDGFTITGLGHSWPTTLGLDTADGAQSIQESTAPFNATTAFIIPFFEAHPLT